MSDYTKRDYLFFILTVIAAFVLSIFPVPVSWAWFRPNWMMLVLLFWVVVAPEMVAIGWVWLIGLMQDVLLATPLGLHCLCFVFVYFLMSRRVTRLQALPMWQQCGLVTAILLGSGLAMMSIMLSFHRSGNFFDVLIAALLGGCCWPWLCWLLRRYQLSRVQLH